MTGKLTLLASIILFTLLSCGTYNSYRGVHLQPAGETEETYLGKPEVNLEYGGLSLKSTFLQSTPYDLLFDLTIINWTEDAVEVYPEDFSFNALDATQQVLDHQYAFRAEDILFEIDESIEADKKAAKATNALGWVFFGLNLAAATVSVINDNEIAAADFALDAGFSLAGTQIEKSAIKKHIVHLEGERDFYENKTIRNTVLAPGDTLQGIVVFPRADYADQLRFDFPMHNQRFEIIYNQVLLRR